MANQNATQMLEENEEQLDLDALERKLEEELQEELSDLTIIDDNRMQLDHQDSMDKIIINTIWEQFENQIAVLAGEDFIKSNNGLTLDLRNEAHIQTTENFSKGKIATHNTEIDYKQRYDDWQNNFKKDENGNVVKHTTKARNEVETLTPDARKDFDKNRPSGSKNDHTQMDHTVSAAEIIRDPAANAHMSREEQIKFANSEANLNVMDAQMNQSKGDLSMDEWLDNPNSKGQKPNEIFIISEEEDRKLREKDRAAREEYERQKTEAENRSKEAGKHSQKQEALRIGKKAARAVILNLLADLLKRIVQKFIAWLKSSSKNLDNLIRYIKEAILSFINELKSTVLNISETVVTVILTSLVGPIVSTLKKAWMFIKQGWTSIKEIIAYIRNPENREKPIEVLLLEVGKIVVAGLSAAGAIVLSEVIEKALITIPGFAIEIPLLGSIANTLGIFMGAVISGIIGAISIHMINRLIEKKQKQTLLINSIEKSNEILNSQQEMIMVNEHKLDCIKNMVSQSITERHKEASRTIQESLETIKQNVDEDYTEGVSNLNMRLDALLNNGEAE